MFQAPNTEMPKCTSNIDSLKELSKTAKNNSKENESGLEINTDYILALLNYKSSDLIFFEEEHMFPPIL